MKNFAVCIGHNPKKKGFFSRYLDSTEYDYNTRVANLLQQKMPSIDVYKRTSYRRYNDEIGELASRVNQKDYDLVFELHFNSYNKKVQGVEALHYYNSIKGKEYATSFCDAIEMEYGLFNRGAKPLNSGNGYGFVKKIEAPSIILEPVFADERECLAFLDIDRYTDCVIDWLKCL